MRVHETETAVPVRERIAQVLSDNLGVNRENVAQSLSTFSFAEVGMDSLDMVELVMELENEFDVVIPDEEAEKIRTPGDAVDCLLRHLP